MRAERYAEANTRTYLTTPSNTEGMCPGSLAKQDVSFLPVAILKVQQIRTSICAPVDASNFNVLEKDEVQRELRNGKYQAPPLVRDGTFSILPPAKPTTTALPFQAIHLSESIGKGR